MRGLEKRETWVESKGCSGLVSSNQSKTGCEDVIIMSTLHRELVGVLLSKKTNI